MNPTPDLLALAYRACLPKLPGESNQAFEVRVGMELINVMRLSDPQSRPMKMAGEFLQCQPIRGVLMGVEKASDKSNRANLVLWAVSTNKETKEKFNQREEVVTARLDDPEGVWMVNAARDMIGHEVVVFKGFDHFTQNGEARRKRVCRYIASLGKADGWQIELSPSGKPSKAYKA